MYTTKIQEEKVEYDIAGSVYVCQICGYRIMTRPPEWCPVCKNHRVIFKRTPLYRD